MVDIDLQLRLSAQATLALVASNVEPVLALRRVAGSRRLWRLAFPSGSVVAVGALSELEATVARTSVSLVSLARSSDGLCLTFSYVDDGGLVSLSAVIDGYRPD